MTTENNTTGLAVTAAAEVPASYRSLSWRAIIAGTVAGLAIHLLLTLLGLGLGIGSLEPITDENPATKLGLGAAIAWGVSALIALWSGGWVAGRFVPATFRRSGALHGFLVWSVAMIAMVVLATSGVGMAMSGAAKVIGFASKPVAAAASGTADLAKDAIKQNTDAIGSYVDEALQSRGQNANPGAAVRAKREIGYALTRLFAPGSDVNSQEKRGAVIRAMTDAGVSEQDANRMLTEWTASYQRMKADLQSTKDNMERQARETAQTASKVTSHAAVWSFAAFLLGAVVASLGGKVGASGNTIEELPRRRV